jgi:hypothetical protein
MTRRPTVAVPVLLLAALLALLLAAVAPHPSATAQSSGDPDPVGEPVSPLGTGRLAGEDRIGTAIAIAGRAFPQGAPVVYLANAETFVDAVAGGSLTDGPILLVPACDLPQAVADELRRLAPDQVIALGGTVAVCDRVLESAASAAGIGGGGEDQPDAVVTATAELVDASGEVPFIVEATDPGILFEGGTFDHEIRLTGTDGSVVLDDPRFSDVLTDGAGQLLVAGRGCEPFYAEESGPGLICQDDFQYLLVEEGQTTAMGLTLHTDDADVGPTPVLPGTYVLDQPVRWDTSTDPSADAVEFDEGNVTIRITYTVSEPSDGSDAEARVVTWSTSEGDFRTSGHSAADLERIAGGVERGEHIGIPNGVILRGDDGVNVGREWHLEDIEIVDVTIEVCDGTADYVSENLEDYLAIGRYCPWGAVPVAIDG